jgi:hypothetical protein
MKNLNKFVLSVLLFSTSIYSYGSKGHIICTKAIINVLRANGYNNFAQELTKERNINGQSLSYIELILYGYNGFGGVESPDVTAYYDPEFENIFGGILRNCYDGLIPPSIQNIYTYENFKNKIASFSQSSTSNVADLQKGTQHTYCVDIQGDNLFDKLSKANYFASKEYEKAIEYKNTIYFQSLAQLGRVLHYIQDVTVPHHAKLKQNISDLFLVYQNGGNQESASQYKYESMFISQNYSVDNSGTNDKKPGEVGYIPPSRMASDWVFRENNQVVNGMRLKIYNELLNQNLSQIVINNATKAKTYFDYCDGLCAYELHCSDVNNNNLCDFEEANYRTCFDYSVFSTCDCDESYAVFDGQLGGVVLEKIQGYLEVPYRLITINIGPFTMEYELRGQDDNFTYVSEKLFTEAVNSCAAVLIKYFNAKKDFPISIILNLLD